MHRSVRRLTAAVGIALTAGAWACDEYAVESCPAGQGVTIADPNAPRLGPEGARVELELFGDFQCPGTRDLWFHLAVFLDQLEADGKADAFQIRFHNFPLTAIHERAYAAALAAEAAHAQGNDAFWAIFPLLLKTAVELTDEDIAGYASTAGLDTARFAEDLDSPDVAAAVACDSQLAASLDLPGTPSALLCGIEVSGDPDTLVPNLKHLLY
jgi:protein-disulfide isomerase